MKPEQPYNIAFLLGGIARDHGSLPAIVAADLTITYQRYWRITRGFATRLRELGIGRGSFLMVHTRDMVASLATLHAAAQLGARYATYDAKIAEGAVMGVGRPDLLLHTPEVRPDARFPSTCIMPDWIKAAPENDDQDDFSGFAGPEAPWLLVETSGTTGTPKLLWLTAEQIYLRTKASQDDFTFGKTRFCALFPCNTRPFFARANAAMLSACTIVDTIDVAFMQKHGVDLFCASPRTAIAWLAGRRIEPKLPLIQVSGARLVLADLKVLLQSFQVVEDVYGASETSKTHVNRLEIVDGKLSVRGRRLDSRVEIVDQTGTIVEAAGKPGLLRVANPYVNCDYVGQPAAKAKVWQGGFFHSGDLACWGPTRELVVLGRQDQIINLGGHKIDPGQVEEVLRQANFVTASAVMAIPRPVKPPQLMALVTLSDSTKANEVVAEARAICERSLPKSVVPTLICVVQTIPQTLDGSPQRAACAKIAEELLQQIEKRGRQDNAQS